MSFDPTPVQLLPSAAPSRRGFLGRLAAAAAVLSGAGYAGATAEAQGTSAAPARAVPGHELDRWLDALTGVHRQVYDVVTPAGSVGIAFARNFLAANNEAYGLADRDISSVVSFRHSAIPFAFTDALWARYRLGETFAIQDPDTKAPATRNPQTALIIALQKRGVVFAVCGMALRHYAGEAAQKSGRSADEVRAEWAAGLFPGTVEAAAGVIVLNRAQERGFSYVYAG